ncbi:MAG: hypothetical protein ACI3ZT_07745 [Candidatus Cryptobacteroides sp.]
MGRAESDDCRPPHEASASLQPRKTPPVNHLPFYNSLRSIKDNRCRDSSLSPKARRLDQSMPLAPHRGR